MRSRAVSLPCLLLLGQPLGAAALLELLLFARGASSTQVLHRSALAVIGGTSLLGCTLLGLKQAATVTLCDFSPTRIS